MNSSKLTDREKDVVYDALSNYQELIENAVLNNLSLEEDYRERLGIIEYLLTELSYESGERF